jgi:MFS family permease
MSNTNSATHPKVPFYQQLGKIKRDLQLNPAVMISTVLQGLFTIILLTATILFLVDEYTNVIAFIALGVVVVSFIIGGLIIDYSKNMQLVEWIMDSLGVVLYFLGAYISSIRFILIIVLAAILPQIILVTFTTFICQTNMLNRGRYTMILLFIISATYGPVFLILQYFDLSYLVTSIGIVVTLVLIFVWGYYRPLPNELFQVVETNVSEGIFTLIHGKKSDIDAKAAEFKLDINEIKTKETDKIIEDLKEDLDVGIELIKKEADSWFRSLIDSGLIPLLIITFIVSSVIGFNISLYNFIFDLLEEPIGAGGFIFAVAGAIFICAIIIDYWGRKVVALITGLMMGFYSIYFNMFSAFSYEYIWFFLFPISASFSLMFLASIIGDLAEKYRRGQIISSITIATILGIVFGYSLQPLIDLISFITEETIYIAYSNFMASSVLICVTLLNFTPETFDRKSIHWRKYVDRLYILSNAGVNLFYHNFLTPTNPDDTESDLVSGGISGIQSLIKEISHSNQQLNVLDHGDRKFIFVHGEFSTAILIAMEQIPLLHIKLAKFHHEFEIKNRTRLENFTGFVMNFEGLTDGMLKYFDQKI